MIDILGKVKGDEHQLGYINQHKNPGEEIKASEDTGSSFSEIKPGNDPDGSDKDGRDSEIYQRNKPMALKKPGKGSQQSLVGI